MTKANISSFVILFLTVNSLAKTSEDVTLPTINGEPNVDNMIEVDNEPRGIVDGSLPTTVITDNGKIAYEWRLFSETRKRTILADNKKLWSSRNISYVVAPNFPVLQRSYLHGAMEVIENACCLRFHELQAANVNVNEDYFEIKTDRDECSSGIGRWCKTSEVGCKTDMYLGPQCDMSTMLHELMHLLGFVHEQSRPDRGKYVKIMYENIRNVDIYRSNFDISPQKVRTDTPYDFDSVMHYRLGAISKPGVDTIRPIVNVPDGVNIGQKEHLSEMDIVRLNRYYCGVSHDKGRDQSLVRIRTLDHSLTVF